MKLETNDKRLTLIRIPQVSFVCDIVAFYTLYLLKSHVYSLNPKTMQGGVARAIKITNRPGWECLMVTYFERLMAL